MTDKISEIKDMDEANAAKLAAVGVTTTAQLLEKALDSSARSVFAKAAGVDSKALTEWVNRADLMRLKGVGTEMANLLEECGVDSCKELQHRVAANLQTKLKDTNDTKKITHHAPSLSQVEEWIKEASEFAGKK